MIIAGFGFRGAATADSLRDAMARAADTHTVEALCAPDDKASATCLSALAASLQLPIVPIAAADLAGTRTATCSPRVLALRKTGSVAEAAALVGAGRRARLLSTRQISSDRLATCAVAIGDAS